MPPGGSAGQSPMRSEAPGRWAEPDEDVDAAEIPGGPAVVVDDDRWSQSRPPSSPSPRGLPVPARPPAAPSDSGGSSCAQWPGREEPVHDRRAATVDGTADMSAIGTPTARAPPIGRGGRQAQRPVRALERSEAKRSGKSGGVVTRAPLDVPPLLGHRLVNRQVKEVPMVHSIGVRPHVVFGVAQVPNHTYSRQPCFLDHLPKDRLFRRLALLDGSRRDLQP